MKSVISDIYQYHHRNNHREYFAYFEKERGKLFSDIIGRGKRVLDLGCRDGTMTKYFTKGNTVLGVDIDKRLLAICKKNLYINTRQFDLNSRNWPFTANSFDVIVAGEILEHLYFPKEVIKKVFRILKPGGIFVGSVPNAFHILERVRFLKGQIPNSISDPTHLNVFSISIIRNVFKSIFPDVEVHALTVDKFHFLAKSFPDLFADDIVFVGKKI